MWLPHSGDDGCRSVGTVVTFLLVHVSHEGMNESVFGIFDTVVAPHSISRVHDLDARRQHVKLFQLCMGSHG